MQNPIAKLVPQYFGEYPKPFQKLFDSISLSPDEDKENVKSILWKAYEFGKRQHQAKTIIRRSIFFPLLR